MDPGPAYPSGALSTDFARQWRRDAVSPVRLATCLPRLLGALPPTRCTSIRIGDQGIDSGIHYPIPMHLQDAYAGLGYKMGDFPYSEKAAKEVLSLPIFPELSETQINEVVAALRVALERRSPNAGS